MPILDVVPVGSRTMTGMRSRSEASKASCIIASAGMAGSRKRRLQQFGHRAGVLVVLRAVAA